MNDPSGRGRKKQHGDDEAPSELIHGLHPVLEAIESGRRTIDRVLVARGAGGGIGRVLRLARARGIPVRHVPREGLTRRVGARGAHQGIAAVVSPVAYLDPDVMEREARLAEDPILIALDGVEDPRNLGAILRTACGAGAQGVYLGGESTVGVTAAAAKASAGAAERIPVSREVRLARRIASLRAGDFRVLGLDPKHGVPWDRVDLTGRLVLVVGAEGKGLRRSTAEHCSEHVAIPLAGPIDSLNVSVALAVVLFEAIRQRRIGAVVS